MITEKKASRLGLVLFVLLLSSSFTSYLPDSNAQTFGSSNSTSPTFIDQVVSAFSQPAATLETNGHINTYGANFNNTFDPSTHTGAFVTHPDWLLDYYDSKGNPVFIPYKITNYPGYINFESSHDSVTFYKNSCTIAVYPGGKIKEDSKPIIGSVNFDLQSAKNGSDIWNDSTINQESCDISYSQKQESATFDLVQGSTVTKDIQFNFNLYKIPETIMKVKNNDQSNTDTKYGYAVVLGNAPTVSATTLTFTPQNTTGTTQLNSQQFNGTILKIKDNTTTLKFDTQNNINHYLWATKITPDDNGVSVILDYKNSKGPLAPGDTLEIDPTFTSGAGISYSVDSTNTDPNFCNTYSNTDGASRTTTPASGSTGGTNFCVYNVLKFSIAGFSKQWTATQVNYQYTINFNSGGDKACTYTQELNDPAVTAGATLFNDVRTGTTYLTGDTLCETISGPNSVNLGSTAKTDFNNQVSSGLTWFAIGGRFDTMTKNHAHLDETDWISNNIIVTYSWNPPAPITDTACSDNAINSIACSWSVPASPTTILGYYETLNNTLHAPLYDKSLVGYWKLDYNDPVSGIIDYSSTHDNGTVSSGSFVNKTGIIASGMNFTGSTVITIPNNAATNFERTNPFSFFIWAKASQNGIYNTIFSNDDVGPAYKGLIFQVIGGNNLCVWISNNIGTGNYLSRCTTGTPLTDLNFHHIGFTYDGSSSVSGLKIYSDGVELSSTTGGTTVSATTITSNSLFFGKENDCNCNNWKGILDDGRFYSKLLVPSEITKLDNYRIINTNSFTNTAVKYPFTYNVNVQGVSYNGMINNYLGNTVQIAPYNVIDPPYQVKATLGSDTNGFFENVTWSKPKVANSICGSLCSPNGYQLQHYNTTTHTYQTDSSNQTALFKVIRALNQNTTQNIRLFTNNHAGLSARTFPLNSTTYPQEVSHWMLQNNLIDTRNLNNGTLTGNWNFTTGRNGNAQVMDGSTYDVMGSSSIPVGTNDRTIITWIYPTAFTSNSNAYFSYGTSSANAQFSLIDANGKIDCGGAGNNVNSTTTLTVNKWNMVSCVLSNTGQTRQIYLNTTLDKSSTTTALNTASSANTYIGTRVDSTSHAVTSLIGDTRIFSSALTVQQITNIYNEAIASRSNFAGSLALQVPVVGNVAANNGTISISTGFPSQFVLKTYNVKNGSSLLNTTNTSTSIGTSYHIPLVWDQLSTVTNSNFKMSVLINATGNGIQNLTSNIVTTKGTYNPTFTTTSGVTYNYTVTRPSPGTNLTLGSNITPKLFNLNCQIQTASQAGASSNSGWYNKSNVGYFLQSVSVHNYDNMYGSCFTPSNTKIFTFVSYGNSSLFPAIHLMDTSYGAYLGVPVGVVFIVMAASLGNRRTAPMWAVIILAIAGIMATIGFFTLNPGVWALALIAGLLCLFVGRKF